MSEESFKVGVAISLFQNSGGIDTNWNEFELRKGIFGGGTIKNGDRVNESCNFWDNYEDDILKASRLNCNSFRLSLEWSRLELREGMFSGDNIAHYHKIFQCLLRHNLIPNITLYHFVAPSWFVDLGGFEKKDNIKYFVNFVIKAYKEFGHYTDLWATFNEINVETFCGYIYGSFPPGRLCKFSLAGQVLYNMFNAHVQAYKSIKSLPGGSLAKIGVIHNYLEYDMENTKSLSSCYLGPLTSLLNKVWANDTFINYFKNGIFEWNNCFCKTLIKENDIPCCDWLCSAVLNWRLAPTCKPDEKMTDMPYPLHAPGFYKAIKELSKIGLPLYITETGVADKQDTLRSELFTTYFAEVEKAISEGIEIKGLYYWTLVDNFEWAEGFSQHFGLYRWSVGDKNKRQELKSTNQLRSIFAQFPQKIRHLKDARTH